MKKKDNKQRGGIFTLLLGNYIAFTLVLVLALAGIVLFFGYRLLHNVQEIDPSQIRKNDALLAEGWYTDFPTERLLGKEGFIAVLDTQGNTVYNGGTLAISLKPEELAFIPDYSIAEQVTAQELKTANGGVNYQITYESGGDSGDSQESVYILGQNYKLLYGSGKDITTDLTQREYELLTQTYFKNCHVSKYNFQNADGSPYTLLLFQTHSAVYTIVGRIGSVLQESMLCFLAVYCLLILFFIIWLRKKITQPLLLLCTDLNQFEIGSHAQNDYRGPREFREIFDSFFSMAKRLEKAEQEKAGLAAEKQRMLSGIAHDLKTPITVIQGYAKALDDGVIPQSQQSGYFKLLEKKSAELNDSILSFYEYNKLEHPDYRLSPETVDICNYFRNYAAEKYEELEAARFQTEADLPEIHPLCSVDRTQLRRVFENIVGNSVKYNPPGTTLYFELREEEKDVVLMLGDNGCGIPPELGDAIFDPFVVGEKARNRQGSGLGLSIARKIVEAHGGTLSLIQGRHPCSAAFEIRLPKQ